MKQILKRSVTRDAMGRALSSRSKRLTDDGRGRIHVTESAAALRCSGCRRPLSELTQISGQCDVCARRGTCERCEVQCRACSRRLCGQCRRGFSGPPPLTVCPICLPRLNARQFHIDRIRHEQLMHERRRLAQRERLAIQSLRLHAARTHEQYRLAMVRERNRATLAFFRSHPRGWFTIR